MKLISRIIRLGQVIIRDIHEIIHDFRMAWTVKDVESLRAVQTTVVKTMAFVVHCLAVSWNEWVFFSISNLLVFPLIL